MISALASAGVFVAVPLTGWLALGRLRMPIPTIARASLWISAGLAIWSLPLLVSLVLGVYHPELLGAAGWVTAVAILAARRLRVPSFPRLKTVDRVVLVGLLLSATLAAAFPADPFTVGRDMTAYANHAVYMANHGRLDVPYPWALDGSTTVPPYFDPFGHFYPTQPTMTAPFGHLFPAWLAQTYAVAGYEGLVRLNVVLGLFALLAIYGLARRFVDARVAAVAILFLAFNPAQIWVTRQTLSEIPTQLLIWSGLLLLTAYLARGRPRWGLWAGILLGVSAFIRIDAFLLVPFLLLSHATWNVLRRDHVPPRRVTWRYVYLGSLPLFGLALGYYALFSRPYLVDIRHQLLQIGALTIVVGVLFALTILRQLRHLAVDLLSRRMVLVGLLGGLALLTAYAYFVRPILPPFGTIDAPGLPWHGRATRAEDALPNLGRYLTPGVVWAALAGWSVLFVRAIKRPRAVAVVPLLVMSLAFTAVYVWGQNVAPQHFWAIRRFVPVIIPAVVLFASLAGGIALGRLSRPGQRLALGLSVTLLVAFTFHIGIPTYAVQERQGSYNTLREFAGSMPPGGEVLALGGYWGIRRWWAPLYVSFDTPVIPLNVTTYEGWSEALRRLRGASQENPVLIATVNASPIAPVQGNVLNEATVTSTIIDDYAIPVPRSSRPEQVTLATIEATGLDSIGVELVARPPWLVLLGGMYSEESIDGESLRWTNGHGRALIPLDGDILPDRVQISLADTGPTGGDLRIILNGSVLYDGAVPAGPWSSELDLGGVAGIQSGGTADLEIISGTFPRSYPGARETLELGVQIRGVTFVAPGD